MLLEGRATIYSGTDIASFDIDVELVVQQIEDAFSAEYDTTKRCVLKCFAYVSVTNQNTVGIELGLVDYVVVKKVFSLNLYVPAHPD